MEGMCHVGHLRPLSADNWTFHHEFSFDGRVQIQRRNEAVSKMQSQKYQFLS